MCKDRISSLTFTLCLCLLLSVSAVWAQSGATRLSELPAAAQSNISAALGHDFPAFEAHAQPGGFHTEDLQHYLSADFSADGVDVRSGSANWHMQLSGYGYGLELQSPRPAHPQGRSNRVEYQRGSLLEWYVNGPVGLEQGFTISQPPAQSRNKQSASNRLTLAWTLSGNLTATDVDHKTLLLTDRAGNTRLRYTGLAARDADGRELNAGLELQGNQLLLKVEDRGARYPLVIDPWVQTAELSASNGAAGDQFGWSVATSGSTVVVGAPFHALSGNPSQGAAYIFVEPSGGWSNMTQTAELSASNGAANAYFGTSVAISGNTVVVGANGTTVQGNAHQGAAYVFVEPANGWVNMTETAELTASDGYVGDNFGESVAISGNTIVAGAPYASIGSNFQQGAAYVFVEPGSGWIGMTQTAKLTSSDGEANNIFGVAVAIDGNTVVAGADEATVNGDQSAGEAYVFARPASGWADMTQSAELTASDATADGYFGASVAVAGSVVVVGAPSDFSGAVYVFVPRSGTWTDMTQTAELTASGVSSPLLLGTSVAISGNTVMAGAVGAIVGANQYQGMLYVFVEPGSGWADMNPSGQLVASDGAAGDYFGRSLSTSSSIEAISAPFHQVGSNDNQGVVYVFQPLNHYPTGTTLSPSNAIVGGAGFLLTVNGANFVQGSVVEWNGSPRSTQYVNSTQLQAQILASDIAVVGSFKVRVTNPPPGGGNSNSLTFTVDNPVPLIGSLSPNNGLAGGGSFTLTVNGGNFVSTSKVMWNGSRLTTTFVSGKQLTATVPASFIKTAGTVPVTVFNPTPGGGTSNTKTFSINNPVPGLTSLTPSSIKAGKPAFSLIVTGTGFITNSQVEWNGQARTTTYEGPAKLKAQILASDIAQPGTAKVTATNPAPGGGTSNYLTFTINQ